MKSFIKSIAVALVALLTFQLNLVNGQNKPKGAVIIPQIDGEWWDITSNPELGKYASARQEPVDFAVWQAKDGTFQLWSCIRNTNSGGKTRLFYRWEGKNIIDNNWKPMGICMEADTTLGEEKSGLQAPFVIKDNERYLMFYGDWNRICLAESADGKSFKRVINKDNNPCIFTDSHYKLRDPMVMKSGDTWYCYYCGHTVSNYANIPKSAIFCRTSKDLKNWGDQVVVSTGGSAKNLTDWYGGDAECPFVVKIGEKYMLFRNQVYGINSMNTQYYSPDPLNFGVDNDEFLVWHLPYAAPEIIKVGEQYYIVALKPGLDGMKVAKLKFVKNQLGFPNSFF